ncbi:hypothetical protein A4X09_0g5746 [Tilletia walkeri]|uniref:Ribosomal protein L17 n=1 Tax=Tilletia walkeri TaxID=117179 RepID=A0A8X7N5S2_9BASI|nr:hypothetical protein A4X09_0g5746 [Tilletia walkeri]
MKGLAFRKLSRTKSHRNALLRNLVTSLFQHDRIVTTVAKAKEAAREAEKLITLGKRSLAAGTVPRFAALRAGLPEAHWQPDVAPDAARTAAQQTGSQSNHVGKGQQAHTNARIYLYSPAETLPHLYTLAERYAARPGGYTRIHLMGHRKGDHAPRAVLELVDGPRDVRLEMTARAVGRQLYVGAAAAQTASMYGTGTSITSALVGREPSLDAASVEKVVKRFLTLTPAAIGALAQASEHGRPEKFAQNVLGNLFSSSLLNPVTKDNAVKVTQFGGRAAVERLFTLATEHVRYLSAQDELLARDEEAATAARKSGSRFPPELQSVAPRGLGASATSRSSDLLVPIDSAYAPLSSAEGPKTRRRHAGEWRPHLIGNTPSSTSAAIASGLISPTTSSSSSRLVRTATHGGTALRVRRGGSESAIALSKGVFARKRLGRDLELLGGRRKAGIWSEVQLGEDGQR